MCYNKIGKTEQPHKSKSKGEIIMNKQAAIIAVLMCMSLTACGKEVQYTSNMIEKETTAITTNAETTAVMTETVTETSASSAPHAKKSEKSAKKTNVKSSETPKTPAPALVTTAKALNESIQTTAATKKPSDAAPIHNVGISRLAGEYYYEVPDPADNSRWIMDGTVSVGTDGTYTYVPNSGSPINGKIEMKQEELADGMIVYWYSFYPDGEDMWINISSLVLGEGIHFINIGNGDGARLELNGGYPPSSNEMPGYAADILSGDHFLGNWSVGRLYITIDKFDDAYQVNVKQATSAAECTTWEYDCIFNGYYLDSTNGRCVEAVYDEEGNISSSVRYTNGCAHFRLNDDNELIWEDLSEHWCDDMTFIQIS